MQYISPFIALNITDFDTFDKSNLTLAKKKLLAELELSPTNTVLVSGQEMSKNDVIKWFDNFPNSSELAFHRDIAKDKTLLSFLENGVLDANTRFLETPVYHDEAFIEFISPYFSSSYKKKILEAIKKMDISLMDNLVNKLPLLMTEFDEEESNLVIENWVEAKIDAIIDLNNQIDDGVRLIEKEIKEFYSLETMQWLNILPESFIHLRDRYAIALYNLSLSNWNTFFRKRAKRILAPTFSLNCSPHERELLRELHNIFHHEDNNGWVLIYWRMYHMTIFEKPQGITLGISWILKILSAPVCFPLTYWHKLTDLCEKYWVGRVFSTIGNYAFGWFTIVYSFFMVINIIKFTSFGLVALSGGDISSYAKSEQPKEMYEDLPLILINLDDSIKYYQSALNASLPSEIEVFSKNQSALAILNKRKALYEKINKRFLSLQDSLKFFLEQEKKEPELLANKNFLEKKRALEGLVSTYKDYIHQTVVLNARLRDFKSYWGSKNQPNPERSDYEIQKFIANHKAQSFEKLKDSIQEYDRILESFIKPSKNIKN